MRLRDIIYLGTEITDKETFDKLPTDLQLFLKQQNGVIAFNGGLQVNSCSETPDWNSIRYYWTSERALYKTYDLLTKEDIPFGLDCVGDHFILRDNQVLRLSGETGDLENLEVSFNDFLKFSNDNPDEFLMLGPLKQFEDDGQNLTPGQLLSVYPFFCMKESANGISVSNVPTNERVEFLKSLYLQLKDVKPGQQIQIKVE